MKNLKIVGFDDGFPWSIPLNIINFANSTHLLRSVSDDCHDPIGTTSCSLRENCHFCKVCKNLGWFADGAFMDARDSSRMAGFECSCVAHVRPFNPPVDTQHPAYMCNQCPCHSFNPTAVDVQTLWSQNYATDTILLLLYIVVL